MRSKSSNGFAQHALAELARYALASRDPSALIGEASSLAARALAADYAGVWVVLPDGTALLQAGTGWQDGHVGQAADGGGPTSLLGQTFRSSAPLIIEDLSTETRFEPPPLLGAHQVRSGMSIMIPGHEHPFGVLGVYAKRRRTFSDADTQFIQTVANVLASLVRRVQMEHALQESEDRYQQLFNNANDIVYTIDLQGNFTSINKGAERLTGYSPEEIRGRHFSLVVAPEHLDRTRAMVARKIQGGGPTTYEIELVAKDGHRFPIELSSQLLIIGGRPVGIQGVARDISERKNAERTLRESETRFRSIAQSTPDGIIVADSGGAVVFCNAAAEKIFGYASDEILGKPLSTLMPPRYRDAHLQGVERIRTTGESRVIGHILELHGLHKDGREFPLELSLATWNAGDATFYSGIIRDITDRKRAETQIKHQLERISALYGVAEQLSQTLDLHRLAEDIVRAAVESFGVTVAWLGRAEPDGALRLIGHFPPETEFPQQIIARWNDSPGAQGVTGRALRTGSSAIVLDITEAPNPPPWRDSAVALGLKCAGGFPLISRDKTFGVLNLYSDKESFFTPERIEFFQAYAHQMAAALENARLYDDAEQRLGQLQALRDIDMAISGSLDLRLTLNVVLETITSQLQLDAATILLLDPQMHTLDYWAGRGFRAAGLQHTHLRVGEGHAGRAAMERRMIRIANITMDPGDFSRAPLLAGEAFVGYIAVPLIAKGHVKGVLEIFHRGPLRSDREWQDFLDALAGQAAVAVDNAGLFDDLQRSNLDLALAYDTTLEGWSRALDFRDKETEGHSRRVTEMTLRLARAMGVPQGDLVHMRRGALLHDIGKMAVPDVILLKPGPLTEEEWVVMRRHPVTAFELLSPIAYLRPAIDIPYCHHEKWDGTGYPRGLRGEQIPIAARLFAVADVWDALRSDRPYRPAWAEERARAHIAEQAGGHFDPRVVEVFLRLLE